jgi:ABC-type transporter Mla subunit MlaD
MSTVSVKDTKIADFIGLKQNEAKAAFDHAEKVLENLDSKIDKYHDKMTDKQYNDTMTDLEKLSKTFRDTNSRVKQTKDDVLKTATDHIDFIIQTTGELQNKVQTVQKKLNKKKLNTGLATLAARALKDAGVKTEDLPEIAKEPFSRHNKTGGKRRSSRKTRRRR